MKYPSPPQSWSTSEEPNQSLKRTCISPFRSQSRETSNANFAFHRLTRRKLLGFFVRHGITSEPIYLTPRLPLALPDQSAACQLMPGLTLATDRKVAGSSPSRGVTFPAATFSGSFFKGIGEEIGFAGGRHFPRWVIGGPMSDSGPGVYFPSCVKADAWSPLSFPLFRD